MIFSEAQQQEILRSSCETENSMKGMYAVAHDTFSDVPTDDSEDRNTVDAKIAPTQAKMMKE